MPTIWKLENFGLNSVYIIADDHPLFRDALSQAVDAHDPGSDLHSVGDLISLRELLRDIGSADLLMLDLSMPGASGFSGLISIRAEFPDTPVAIVSATDDSSTIRKCIQLGASGFIPKSLGAGLIGKAVSTIKEGELWIPDTVDMDNEGDQEFQGVVDRIQSLTPQQTRVLAMLGEGLLNKQIAYELSVSEATVKAHVSAVLMKLGVDSRTQAVIIMNKIGAGFSESLSKF